MKTKPIDKIYSRNRITISNQKVKRWLILVEIIIIAFLTVHFIILAITPIIDKQCENICKSIATKISNNEATKVMSHYQYDDLTVVTKDANGNVAMISANMIIVNEIISDVAVKIQEEMEKEENATFQLKLGSFLGSKLLAGRGPEIEIKMQTKRNVETDLRSEFTSAGINQTLHKIYLEVKCKVSVLTPFHTIEEEITNQVLLAESVIMGTTPNTYYNLEGLTGQEDAMEVIE